MVFNIHLSPRSQSRPAWWLQNLASLLLIASSNSWAGDSQHKLETLSLAPQAPAPEAKPQKPANAPAKLVIEDFEGAYDWTGGNSKNGRHDYVVVADGAHNHLLHADFIPGTDGKMIYKKHSWDCTTYPHLSWRWRVSAMPTGAKIRINGKSDAPAQIYVGWRVNGRLFSLKYFWTDTDPVGVTFREGKWNPFGTYQGIVIRQGGALNEWHTETRNIVEDFKKAFDMDPPPEVNGVGILTDGDGTRTEPQADYDDFIASF